MYALTGVKTKAGDAQTNIARSLRSRALYSLSGTIRYKATTFSVSGSYDDTAGSLEASATATVGNDTVTFALTGTYTPGSGFTGTVNRTINGGAPEEGQVACEATTAAEASSIRYFLGFYAEDSLTWGTWNMIIKDGQISGTYSGVMAAGTIKGTLNGTAINLPTIIDSNDDSLDITATGILSGTQPESVMYGTWGDTTSGSSGTWHGGEVDSSWDPHTDTTDDSMQYLFGQLIRGLQIGIGSIDWDPGVDGPGTYGTNPELVYTEGDPDTEEYTFSGYTDAATGYSFSGKVILNSYDSGDGDIIVSGEFTGPNMTLGGACPLDEFNMNVSYDAGTDTHSGSITVYYDSGSESLDIQDYIDYFE